MCSEKQRVLLLTIASIVLQSVVCKDINTRFLERFTLSPTSTRSPSTTSSPAGVWSIWSSWSACSVTCSAGLRFRARHCVGTSSCTGDIYESEYCSMPRCLHVVDGQWSPWSSWMDCSVTCGTGIKERKRSCDNPAPQDGGKQCSGRPYELSACKIKECPIDGGWSNYTVRPCSKTCGLGVVVSLRTCSEPAPLYGGKPCQGSPTKFEACKEADCIIDGAWSSWTNFTDCSVICGDGHRRRWRKCTAPAPQNGGKNCTGHSHEMDDCTNGNCPKDIKTCDKQKVNNTLTAKTMFQPSCETGNDVTSQVDMINKLCNAPRNETQWELGIAIADNCEAIPLRTPIGLVNRSTREKKYGILLDCYQQILEFATQNCTSGITIQTINLTASATDYHMLLW